MNITEDNLYKRVEAKANWFRGQAEKHKLLNRGLWFATSFLSVLVAICANSEFVFLGMTSSQITAILSIILPVVTGYTVMRSPESLWILEINMRNQLLSLKDALDLVADRESEFNREPYELEYLAIMGEANKQWHQIKKSQSSI